MSHGNGLDECYEAFERLKAGRPNLERFAGITPDKITASVVSQEAGFDSGYLKKKRLNHQGIIALIDFFRTENKSTTLSKMEAIRREKEKSVNYKERLLEIELLLEQSLARELLLACKINELEGLLYQSKL
ncbi:hypothetical protein [Shewanella oncorhynchi]|uniref:hypothetical protein n=1 Tax=Shewanella oncorhynchi TaxID=2726434 RepID=UPI003D78B907